LKEEKKEMDRTHVESLAKKAGLENRTKTVVWSGRIESLIKFADLVAKEEAENCAAIADPVAPSGVADLIRFRYGLS
jgi:hypothetical protein